MTTSAEQPPSENKSTTETQETVQHRLQQNSAQLLNEQNKAGAAADASSDKASELIATPEGGPAVSKDGEVSVVTVENQAPKKKTKKRKRKEKRACGHASREGYCCEKCSMVFCMTCQSAHPCTKRQATIQKMVDLGLGGGQFSKMERI
jgi:hypothetical protein